MRKGPAVVGGIELPPTDAALLPIGVAWDGVAISPRYVTVAWYRKVMPGGLTVTPNWHLCSWSNTLSAVESRGMVMSTQWSLLQRTTQWLGMRHGKF